MQPFSAGKSLLLQGANTLSIVVTPWDFDPHFQPDFRAQATVTADVLATPEPGTITLVLSGLAALAPARRRRHVRAREC